MDTELLTLIATGFCAQLVDGALGMGFGVLSSMAVMAVGIVPARASAIVHSAEIFTTGASASWHIFHRNVDWRITLWLSLAGVIGAVAGASVLITIDPDVLRPYVFGYLLVMGGYILLKAAGLAPERTISRLWHAPIGVVAGFLDAGGGGWGSVATVSLIGGGVPPRQTIGSVDTAEFFVTVAAAATFFFELGAPPWGQFVPLVLGGLFAAPFGGWAARRIPPRVLMAAVGVLVIALSTFQLLHGIRTLD